MACKCAFYRPEHNAKRGSHGTEGFKGFDMQKWNIPTDRVQRADKKNGVICLVIMFTPGTGIIKVSKMAQFFVFFPDNSKT